MYRIKKGYVYMFTPLYTYFDTIWQILRIMLETIFSDRYDKLFVYFCLRILDT